MKMRILLSLPLWLAYSALELVLYVTGIVVIASLLATKSLRLRRSAVWPTRQLIGGEWKGGLLVQWPCLAWIWSNEEDGVVGPSWFLARRPKWPGWRHAFVWSALRNPTNNLRFVPGINPVIDPERIQWTTYSRGPGHPFYVYTWQGAYSGLLVVFPFRGAAWRFWWGWKLKPEDESGVDDSDMRKPRCGFAIQLKKVGE